MIGVQEESKSINPTCTVGRRKVLKECAKDAKDQSIYFNTERPMRKTLPFNLAPSLNLPARQFFNARSPLRLIMVF
jgi:hypothetical protein